VVYFEATTSEEPVVHFEDVAAVVRSHQEITLRLGIQALYVFGSVARGEASENSDVDFLVEFEGAPSFDRYMDLKFLLEDALGCTVDLVTRAALKPRMRDTIEKEARLVA
jgi:uncharacterized protein